MRLYFVLFRDLMKRLGWRFIVLVIWTAVIGLGEGTSIVLLLPLLSRIGITTANSQNGIVKILDNGLAAIGATEPLSILAVIVLVVTLQTALSVALTWWTSMLGRRYQSQRQLELLSAVMNAKWRFIADKKAGDLTNAIITECERLGAAFTICMALLASVAVTAIYIVLSLIVAWQVTLSLVAIAAVTGLAMSRLYRTSYTIGRRLAPLNAELQSAVGEYFAGARYIKASAAVDRATARIGSIVRKLEWTNATASSLPGTARSLLEAFGVIGLAVVLVSSSRWMGAAGGNVVVVLALFGRLYPRISSLQAYVHHLSWNVPVVEVLGNLQTAALAAAEPAGGASKPMRVGLPTRLTIDGLGVKLGRRQVLNRIDLTMPIPGMVALVGRSGAGKSTLIHALLGLVEPTAGSIRLDGHDMAATPLNAWRRSIGYVPQETALFHASIRDNLAFINPDASDEEIRTAARRAHALEFIEAHPDGFDTIIGDQGVNLSGGQRQRLSIARALLTNPPLLLLDEAMSALDAQSEVELLRTIEDLRREMAILIVAHRLGAVRVADCVYVMEGGKIVESGTWEELMARKAGLHALVEAQSLTETRAMADF